MDGKAAGTIKEQYKRQLSSKIYDSEITLYITGTNTRRAFRAHSKSMYRRSGTGAVTPKEVTGESGLGNRKKSKGDHGKIPDEINNQ